MCIFLSLRAAFFSSSDINPAAASRLLENECCHIFDENNHKPPELSFTVLEGDGMWWAV